MSKRGKLVAAEARYRDSDHVFRDVDPYAKAKYDLTLRWLRDRIRPGALIYNIGCGGGYFNALVEGRGARVVACEPDPQACALAAARARTAAVYNCGLEDFASGREAADVVVMHDVLEHIEDERAAVAALARIVRVDGAVALSVPAGQWLFGLHDELLGHYRRYGARRLRAVVEPHFHIERLQMFGMLSIPIVLWFSRWRRKPYPLRAGAAGNAGNLYGRVCRAESFVPEPVGTSIVLLARPL